MKLLLGIANLIAAALLVFGPHEPSVLSALVAGLNSFAGTFLILHALGPKR